MNNTFINTLQKNIIANTNSLWLPLNLISDSEPSWFWPNFKFSTTDNIPRRIHKTNISNCSNNKSSRKCGSCKHCLNSKKLVDCRLCENCQKNRHCDNCSNLIGRNASKCKHCKEPIKKSKYKPCLMQVPIELFKAKKIKIKLNFRQKFIVQRWLHACTSIYNQAVDIIMDKHNKYTKKINKYSNKKNIDKKKLSALKTKLRSVGNFYKLRKKLVNETKILVKQSYKLDINQKQNPLLNDINAKQGVPVHIINASVAIACSCQCSFY